MRTHDVTPYRGMPESSLDVGLQRFKKSGTLFLTARLSLAACDGLAGEVGNGQADMEDAMNHIVILYFDPGYRRLLHEVLELEGYQVSTTHEPAEAFRMVMESATPCLMLTDNLKVNPAARDALSTLPATPVLRRRVRVIGLDIELVRSAQIDAGLVDDFIAMPFTVETLLESIEANFAKLSAQ